MDTIFIMTSVFQYNHITAFIPLLTNNIDFQVDFVDIFFFQKTTSLYTAKEYLQPLLLQEQNLVSSFMDSVISLDTNFFSLSHSESILNTLGFLHTENLSIGLTPYSFGLLPQQGIGDFIKIINATDLENFFRNFSFVFLFFAMIYYWTETAFDFLTKYKLGSFLITLANLSLAFLLILRWKISGHFPLSNLYESLMFLSWSCTMLYFIMLSMLADPKNTQLSLASKHPGGILNNNNVNKDLQKKIIGCITSPVALLMNAYATFSLPKEMQQAAPLVPALQSNWLMMHVTVMILSYAALILGSLLSMAFLILTFKSSSQSLRANLDTQSIINQNQGFASPSIAGARDRVSSSIIFDDRRISVAKVIEDPSLSLQGPRWPDTIIEGLISQSDIQAKPAGKEGLQMRTKMVENLDNYSYRIIGIGFSFLTIGILSGAVWANEAWGSYWSWDPKETWAFLTWLIYAIYLHTRFTKGWEGKKPAIIASVGFITVWICFLGVNLIGKGLHSYGFLTS